MDVCGTVIHIVKNNSKEKIYLAIQVILIDVSSVFYINIKNNEIFLNMVTLMYIDHPAS